MRLISFLPGEPLAKISPHPTSMLRRFGSCLGQMDRAMRHYKHPQAVRDLTWDLANVGRVRDFLSEIKDPDDQALADRALAKFEKLVLPELHKLPRQVGMCLNLVHRCC